MSTHTPSTHTPSTHTPRATIATMTARAALSTAAVAAVLLGALTGPARFSAHASAAADDSCPTAEVVFARGTWEAPGIGATGQAFLDALTARLPGKTVQAYGVNYPASLDFSQAADGVADAATKVQAIAASCPTTKIVLGGYSQGAAVAGFTTADTVPAGFDLPAGLTGPMPAAIAPHVAAVVLFGTPDPWFLSLADHDAPPITIGAAYTGKTLQLCATGDPICYPGGLDRAAHSSYKTNGMTDQAADFTAHQLGATPTPLPAATLTQTAGQTDPTTDQPTTNPTPDN